MSKIRAGILSAASPLPPGFDAAAFVAGAVVDQNFMGLGGTPGSWEVTSGTEDYNVDGLTQADPTELEMRLDISGPSNITDVPGWLLVNFSYTDPDTTFILVETANLADTRRQIAVFVGEGGPDFSYNARRIESDNAVDCIAGGILIEGGATPTANEVWLGVHTSFTSPADQYEEGTFYLVDDPDLLSVGSYTTNDPCGDFAPGVITYIRFSVNGVSAGDVTIKRLLFWDTYPGFEQSIAVMAELGFTVP